MKLKQRIKKLVSGFTLIFFLSTSVQSPVFSEPSATQNDQSQWVPTVSLDQVVDDTPALPSTSSNVQDDFENQSPLSAPTPPPTSEQIIQAHFEQAQQTVDAVTVDSTILDFGPIETKLKETIATLKAIMKSLTDDLTEKGDNAHDVKQAEDYSIRQ